jgi:glycosyltransferase involved in cell wall biosynthesis
MKVALVYDRVNKWGGAERVLLSLQKLFPQAPLFTSVYQSETALWARKFEVKSSFLQQFPHVVGHHEMYPFLMPLAFEQFSFTDYDLVISVTSESAKGILTLPKTKHICYCLTPTRYLWSGYDEYFHNPALRFFSTPIISYLKKWDTIAASRPDTYVAISEEVKKRIHSYYQRDSTVIYPPAFLSLQKPLSHYTPTWKKSNYFLIVSRLSKFTQYKRIDLAIQSCNELKLPLIIVGEGSWQRALQAISGPTITFVGSVDDTILAKYYANCSALLFPAREDFGLTVVEAQGFGKPVIAYRGGGALETIKEGKTGLFFDQQTKESLMKALQQFQSLHFDSKVCIKNAQRFSEDRFAKQFLKLVNQVI